MKKIIVLLTVFSSFNIVAREKAASEKNSSSSNSGMGQKVMANCAAPRTSKELWYNNVRTIIYTGGDMWWDLNGNNNAYYYVPAVQNRNTGVSSSFAGSIWLGGLDVGGQLKVAAMTYRQGGIDFWPGPLDTTNASADPEQCAKFDEIFTITRAEVDNFVTNNVITSNITTWPGNGISSKNQGTRLAPFTDKNGDGVYDPATGDFPAYDVENKAEKNNLGSCKTKLFGDYTMFWVFNDNGGIHTETQGVPIGVEVRAQSFAFKTNDEINNMTFYSYEVFNRSSFQLNNTYFTIWNDADLGYYLDDYVGCDVERGLGYIYNADPFDETASGVNGYQDFPPALGCDFFKGPLADYDASTGKGDGIDNDQDGITDEVGETIQMSRFTYYNNNIGAFPPQTTNPDIAIHYYNYMTGKWKDGSFFTSGGNAYGGTLPVTFVYDGDPVKGTGWTEKGAGNLPGDRRFLQSAGPFTLKPGAVNEITFGMPWAQSPSKGGNIQSLELLYNADDKAQALFDNCFKLLDGPEAPDMTVQEVNNELIIYLSNAKGKSNNYKQFNNDYAEQDISIISDPTSTIQAIKNPDKFYRFEGYIIYQLKNDLVSSTDLSDRTKAIPIFQCDVTNGVTRLVNFEVDNLIGALKPTVKVEGTDKGIVNTFRVTEDAFSTLENRKLVNNKEYYFMSVAYAYNQYLKYSQDISPATNPNENYLGQKRPYLEGRKLKRASGSPHNTDAEKDGTVVQAAYGFGPKITRIEGQGNGGNKLTLTRASEAEILNPPFFKDKITYENAQGPLSIKVVDPLNVKNSEFSFRFINNNVKSPNPQIATNAMIPTTSTVNPFIGILGTLNVDRTSWELKDLSEGGKTYHSNEPGSSVADSLYQSIRVGNEFYFQDLGFSINASQVGDPGENPNSNTDFVTLKAEANYTGPKDGSFIDASVTYENGNSNWLNSLRDIDSETPFNWILSGSSKTKGFEDAYYSKNTDGEVQAFYDPNKEFANILNSTWAPYPLCASYYSVTPGLAGKNPSRIFCGPAFSGEAWRQDEWLAKNFAPQSTVSSPDQGNTDLRRIGSVLVVLTRDRAKWTRCAVLEMQEKAQLSQGNAIYFSARNHKSVNKNGDTSSTNLPSENPEDANFISERGMGWFPGYAINLETGERLNLAFGEDSYQIENNGDDMLWNPTANFNSPFPFAFGGKHFVYVFSGNSVSSKYYRNSAVNSVKWMDDFADKEYGVGRYDYGRKIIYTLRNFFKPEVMKSTMNGIGLSPISGLERDIMWVSAPMPATGFGFKKPDQMPSDVRFQINVSKPYRYGWSGVSTINTPTTTNAPYGAFNKLPSVNSPSLVTGDISANPQNNNFPMYTFNTSDIATLYQQLDVAKNSLDLIRVVPNPYYGSSTYETRRIDNFVRITNLPNKCTIKIFTMNGTLIRTIKRDVSGQENIYAANSSDAGGGIVKAKRISYEEWDLKNQNNISIASGLYILHVDAPGIGEKVLKWFGVMRPLDVQNY